jgi:hypothetical protein
MKPQWPLRRFLCFFPSFLLAGVSLHQETREACFRHTVLPAMRRSRNWSHPSMLQMSCSAMHTYPRQWCRPVCGAVTLAKRAHASFARVVLEQRILYILLLHEMHTQRS